MKVQVSDHAIVRYLERVKGMDIQALRKEILPDVLAKGASILGNGYYPVGETHKVRIKNKVVITVLGKDMKLKQPRQNMKTRNKRIRKRDINARKIQAQTDSANEQLADFDEVLD